MGFSLWNIFKVSVFVGKAIFKRIKPHVACLYRHRPIGGSPNLMLCCCPLLSKLRACIRFLDPQAGLLLVNSVLILNRRRFLSKYGLDDLNHVHQHHGVGDAVPLRAQIVGLLHAVQYLKVPVIACNIITIVFEMLLGGT